MPDLGDDSQSFDLDEFRSSIAGKRRFFARRFMPRSMPGLRLPGRSLRLAGVAVGFALVMTAGYFFWNAVITGNALPGTALPAAELVIPTRTPRPTASPVYAEAVPPLVPEPAQATATSAPIPELAAAAPALDTDPGDDTAILALDDGLHSHLFSFSPQNAALTRLTAGAWRDITPAVSPDGRMLAFASNRGGRWDLYLLDLVRGETSRLTDSPEYEGAPSWSPDGRWLAYERYISKGARGGDLEIFIRPIDASQDPIRLTDDPGVDGSPAWAPQGRLLAFVSTRSGEAEIWLADLDRVDNRFENLSRSAGSFEAHPAWSPDGRRLAWASVGADGIHTLRVWDAEVGEIRPQSLNGGDWPVFAPGGDWLLTGVQAPNASYLSGYDLDGGMRLPLLSLPGALNGLAFLKTRPAGGPAEAAVYTPEALWSASLDLTADLPEGRFKVQPLVGLDSAGALHDMVDESFYALRLKTAELAGWDFLSTLENSFVPLTAPVSPGVVEDWMFTGRALRINTAPAGAGWLALVREDFGAQTYWRVYLRARFQDGQLGAPLNALPWDLAARHGGEARAFEQGGRLAALPPEGYWIDFTRLAAVYGWERLPALTTWRNTFSGVRYNELVKRDGRDWLMAMLELYPKAALDTPTPVCSPTITNTPSRTPLPTATATRPPWKSPTPTVTNTRRPTSTPTPTNTPRPTRTPTLTNTPRFSSTPAPAARFDTTPLP